MNSALYRSKKRLGALCVVRARDIAQALSRERNPGAVWDGEKGFLFCPNCGEAVFFNAGNQDEAGALKRRAYFSHHQANRWTRECDLRCDSTDDLPFAQYATLPLFIRPGPLNQEYTLAMGFASANKELLHRVKGQGYRKIIVTCGEKDIKGSISLDDLLGDEWGLSFVPLDSAIQKNAEFHVQLQKADGTQQDVNGAEIDSDWASYVDTFSEAARGGVFSSQTGIAGEKVRNGGYITSGVEYLFVEKETSGGNSLYRRLINGKMATGERVGSMQLPGSIASYGVYKGEITATSKTMSSKDYISLTDSIKKAYGVFLCDSAVYTTPLWPPAYRKGDSFTFINTDDKGENALISLHTNVPSGQENAIMCHSEKRDKSLAVKCMDAFVSEIHVAKRKMAVTINGAPAQNFTFYRTDESKSAVGCPEAAVRFATGLNVTIRGGETRVVEIPAGQVDITANIGYFPTVCCDAKIQDWHGYQPTEQPSGKHTRCTVPDVKDKRVDILFKNGQIASIVCKTPSQSTSCEAVGAPFEIAQNRLNKYLKYAKYRKYN